MVYVWKRLRLFALARGAFTRVATWPGQTRIGKTSPMKGSGEPPYGGILAYSSTVAQTSWKSPPSLVGLELALLCLREGVTSVRFAVAKWHKGDVGSFHGAPFPLGLTYALTWPVNNPLPCNLRSEANKAAKILHEFTQISARNGPDKIIPAHVIAKANGLAILSVFKLGFLVTARGGSGIVIARLPGGAGGRSFSFAGPMVWKPLSSAIRAVDSQSLFKFRLKDFLYSSACWSAPSAIGIAGLGGGFEIGVEVSDLVIILNTRRSVEAFTKGGNVTLGGNLTVAIGPLGRNAEADVALRSTSAVYTYCRSRGLFAGVSLEGSYLVERKDANRKFYCAELRASEILAGEVSPPKAAEPLYEQLENYLMEADQDMLHEATKTSRKKSRRDVPPKPRKTESVRSQASRPAAWQSVRQKPSGSWSRGADGDSQAATAAVVAVRPFRGQLPCDLSFGLGERIDVVTRTKSRDDWWEGRLHGRLGIFPATYVRDC